jgi:hypothetical protein
MQLYQTLRQLDMATFKLINGLAGWTPLDRIIAAATVFIPLITLTGFFWWLLHRPASELRRIGIAACLAGAIVILLTLYVDSLTRRIISPWLWLQPALRAGTTPLLFDGNAGRFPFPEAALLWMLPVLTFQSDRRTAGWFLLAALATALGRVYTGINFPSHMVAAAVTGLLAAITAGLLPRMQLLRITIRPRYQIVGLIIGWGLIGHFVFGLARTSTQGDETAATARRNPAAWVYSSRSEAAISTALKANRIVPLSITMAAIPGCKIAAIEYQDKQASLARLQQLSRLAFAADPQLAEVDISAKPSASAPVQLFAAIKLVKKQGGVR